MVDQPYEYRYHEFSSSEAPKPPPLPTPFAMLTLPKEQNPVDHLVVPQ